MDGAAEAADRGRAHPVSARGLIAAIAVLGALAAAPAAQAGTAHGDTVMPTCSGTCKGFNFSPILRVVYTAAPGESNVVLTNRVFNPATGFSFSLRDQGADVFATGRCERVGTREARCGPDNRLDETVRTGDRDDVYEGTSHAFLGAGDDTGRAPTPDPPPAPGFELEFGTEIDGDEGADVLTGGPGFDTLRGGEGDDRLAGGDSDLGEHLFGGSGRDRVVGSPGGDTLKGDSGRDRVSGGAGIDFLSGNSGDDRVGGDAGRDTVYGRSGKDLVRGGPGLDRLDGGSGRDRIDAGTGDDRIAARDGRRDRVRCGPGRDTVTADRFDVLIRCEVRRLPRR